MSVEVIQQRIESYHCKTLLDQENALKEIAQEIALLALSRSGFFRIAAFQGGTCLRILYGLERFSEDLDFVLKHPDKNFNWENYINNMQNEFNAYGYSLTIKKKINLNKPIKMAFLKADSEGGLLILNDLRTNQPKLQVKLEIDTNPPAGSIFELKYLDFPLPYSIQTQDLASLFASKSHALLCREYTKGRDWYDFSWYISRKTPINFELLDHAIQQAGPWKEENISVTPAWFLKAIRNKINKIDWQEAKNDVNKFLKPRELASLELWSSEFFLSRVDKLETYLKPE